MNKAGTEEVDTPADFESSLKELEALVEQLETGDLSLAESLARFERGVSLSRQCQDMLEQARQTVSVLSDPDNPDSGQAIPPTDPADNSET
ncbi:MAG: exodeoxyribonuclease VII small subunit [Wenzhouxiangella sp.]|nr:MAG: exodeoxyribonuclease VII small subunit [Wenzhouxiangella sp.]